MRAALARGSQRLRRRCAALAVALCAVPLGARGAEIRLAVATNFVEVVEKVRPAFEARTGHRVSVSAGSTGKLYALIRSGVRFDALLAADAATPQRLVHDGEALAPSRFTYALGRLVLWSAAPGVVGSDGMATLRAAKFHHLAIANPDLAPYGAAARDVLRGSGTWDALQPKLVFAQNSGHAYSMVASGNAELGLIALSALRGGRDGAAAGSSWSVPAALHAPIRQDAVLLTRAAAPAAAREFLDALKTPEVRAVIEAFGYARP